MYFPCYSLQRPTYICMSVCEYACVCLCVCVCEGQRKKQTYAKTVFVSIISGIHDQILKTYSQCTLLGH